MAIHNASPCNAHSSRPLMSTATIIVLVVVIFGSLVEQSVADIAKGPVRPIKPSHRVVLDLTEQEEEHHQRSSSNKVGNNASDPQRFFEVSRPVATGDHLVESIQLLYHEFADTYGVPVPNASYVPTSRVLGHKKWDKVVIKLSAVCKGRQFDRIGGVWLGGVEILRTCTAEPTLDGIIWEVEKDVTRFSSLWKEPQLVVVAIGNVVDSTYTGIINVTVSVLFYRSRHGSEDHAAEWEGGDDDEGEADFQPSGDAAKHGPKHSNLDYYSAKPANVILPIAEPSYENGGYWFQLSSETDKFNTSLKVPSTTYKAVLEVCLSPHGNDEFWYTNLPNAYLEANNLTNFPGNGAFREVVASIDGKVVGAVYPFVVVYTGGINPLFWRPAAAIGAFNLPSYDLDITPLLGYLLDGKNHTFSLTVTDALYMWLLQANLHIWVDPKGKTTSGRVVEFSVPSSIVKVDSDFKGLDGTFVTTASRTFSYVGHVASSFGNVTTSSSYTLKFYNSQVLSNDGNVSTIDQLTETDGTVVVKTAEKEVALDRAVSSYPFYFYADVTVYPDGSQLEKAKIVHSLKTDRQAVKKKFSSFSSLSNSQSSIGDLFISVNNTISGIGATQQNFSYQGSDGCYQRAISAKNYTILSDSPSTHCSYSS
ncbi:unnamed protein product [Calypogeia fissa]